jgi:hypothetical protein
VDTQVQVIMPVVVSDSALAHDESTEHQKLEHAIED